MHQAIACLLLHCILQKNTVQTEHKIWCVTSDTTVHLNSNH